MNGMKRNAESEIRNPRHPVIPSKKIRDGIYEPEQLVFALEFANGVQRESPARPNSTAEYLYAAYPAAELTVHPVAMDSLIVVADGELPGNQRGSQDHSGLHYGDG